MFGKALIKEGNIMTIETNILRPCNSGFFIDKVRSLYPDLKVESFIEEYYLDDDQTLEMYREVYRLHGDAREGFIAFIKKWEYETTPMVWEVTYANELVMRRVL